MRASGTLPAPMVETDAEHGHGDFSHFCRDKRDKLNNARSERQRRIQVTPRHPHDTKQQSASSAFTMSAGMAMRRSNPVIPTMPSKHGSRDGSQACPAVTVSSSILSCSYL